MKKSLKLILLISLLCLAIFALGACKGKNKDNNGEGNTPNDKTEHVHSFTVEKAETAYLKSAADCQSKAIYYKSCKCGERGEETFVFGELGEHVFDVMSTDEKYFKTTATCTTPATYYYSCKCGEKGAESFTSGNALPHTFDGYVCTVCSYEKSSDGLILQFIDANDFDDHYYLESFYVVTGYDSTLTDELHIAYHNGYPIRTIAEGAFKNCKTLRSVYLSDKVTDVGKEAFLGCDNLESVHFGKTVYSVEQGAFAYCPKLTDVTLSNENETLSLVDGCLVKKEYHTYTDGTVKEEKILVCAFNNCALSEESDVTMIYTNAFYGLTELTSVIVPNSVWSILPSVFNDCPALREITIGDGVTFIDRHAFINCPYVETVNYNATSLESYDIADGCFRNIGTSTDGVTLNIGKNVEIIPASLFADNGSAASIKIKNIVFDADSALHTIGVEAFKNATSLTSVSFPASVREVGASAFAGCTALTTVTMTDSSINLMDECFLDCTALENLALGNSTVIGQSVFNGCTALKVLVIPDGITEIGVDSFSNCTALRTLSIGKSVRVIPAFYNCFSLTSVYYNAVNAETYGRAFMYAGRDTDGVTFTVGKDAKAIPANLFGDSILNLTGVVFEDGSVCESIGERAFSGFYKLTSITLPSSLKTIGNNAFSDCTSLVEVYNLSDIEIDYNHPSDLGYYCLYVHTSLTSESKLDLVDDFVFFVNGEDIRLVAYLGDETAITLPASYNGESYSINQYAFYGTEIREAVIPGKVTEIGLSAFERSALERVTIEDGVTAISYNAFDCVNLKYVFVPDSVLTVYSKAFTGSAEIFCEATGKPEGWIVAQDPEHINDNFYGQGCTVYWYSEFAPTTNGSFWHYVGGEITAW